MPSLRSALIGLDDSIAAYGKHIKATITNPANHREAILAAISIMGAAREVLEVHTQLEQERS